MFNSLRKIVAHIALFSMLASVLTPLVSLHAQNQASLVINANRSVDYQLKNLTTGLVRTESANQSVNINLNTAYEATFPDDVDPITGDTWIPQPRVIQVGAQSQMTIVKNTVTYVLKPAVVTGTINVKSIDNTGAAFKGNFDIVQNSQVISNGSFRSEDFGTVPDAKVGIYSVVAMDVTVGSDVYTGAVTPSSGEIKNSGDVLNFTVIYTKKAPANQEKITVNVIDDKGNSAQGVTVLLHECGLDVTCQNPILSTGFSTSHSGPYGVGQNYKVEAVNLGGYSTVQYLPKQVDLLMVGGPLVFNVIFSNQPSSVIGDIEVNVVDSNGKGFPGDFKIKKGSQELYSYTNSYGDTVQESGGAYSVVATDVTKTISGVTKTYTPTVTPASATIANNGEVIIFTVTYTEKVAPVQGTIRVTVVDDQGKSVPGRYEILKDGVQHRSMIGDAMQSNSSAGKYTIVNVKDLTVNGKVCKGVVTLKTASDTIAKNGDVVEYVITYCGSTATNGTLSVTVVDDKGATLGFDADYDIIKDGKTVGANQKRGISAQETVGKFSVVARMVQNGNRFYQPVVTLKGSDTISKTGDKVEFVITYNEAPNQNIRGTVTVGVGDDQSPAQPFVGDYDVKVANTIVAQNETITKTFPNQPGGTYVIEARDVVRGGRLYRPTVTSVNDNITVMGETAEFTVIYKDIGAALGGTIKLNIADDQGNALVVDSDIEILRNGQKSADAKAKTAVTINNQLPGKYSLNVKDIYPNGKIYTGTYTSVGTDTIVNSGDIIEFDVIYKDTGQFVEGTVKVDVVDTNGNKINGDFDLVKTVAGASTTNKYTNSINLSGQDARVGKYTVNARSVGNLNPTVTLKSTSDTIARPNDIVEYEVQYKAGSGSSTGLINIEQTPVKISNVDTFGAFTFAGPNGTGFTSKKQATDSYANVDAGDWTITNVDAPAGYDAVVTDATGNVLKAPYKQLLSANGVITYKVTYQVSAPKTALTIAKTFTEKEDQNTKRKRVDYTITITRAIAGTSSIKAVVSDTITGTGLMKDAANGGDIFYVPNTFNCVGACDYKGIADGIAKVPVEVTIDKQVGSKAVITYQMFAENVSQTATASYKNEAKATYTYQGKPETVVSSATVSVQKRPGNGGGGSTGGGGGGGGGGHLLYLGDMKLDITKSVSLDGNTYKAVKEIALPKNKSTKMYVKVNIKNPFKVSAKGVTFKHFFDKQKGQFEASAIDNLKGARVNKRGQIVMDSVQVNGEKEFTYTINVKAKGKASEPAFEGVELVDFGVKLPVVNNGVKFIGLGTKYGTQLYNGRIPGRETEVGNRGKVLDINVKANNAKVGEKVEFVITAKNITDKDLTNVVISHALPFEMSFVDTGYGKVKRGEVSFKRPKLKPGQSAVFKFTTKINDGKVGDRLKNLTRGMTDQYEGITPVNSYVKVLAGLTENPTKKVHLAATGPMTNLMVLLLAMISYIAYQWVRPDRYEVMKRKALDF